MNENAPAPAQPAAPPRRTLFRPAVIVPCLLVLAVGAYFLWGKVYGMFGQAMARPWAVLQEAKTATATEAGAEAFYRAHPGLSEHHTLAAFVAASRDWPQKLALLPATPPDLLTLVKNGARMNMHYNNGRSTFLLRNFREVTVVVVHDGDRLVHLQVE